MMAKEVVSGDPAAVVARRLEDDCSVYFGVPAVRLVPLRRFESEASRVVQMRVEGAPIAEIFLKVLKPQTAAPEHRELARRRVVHEFETTARVHAQMQGLSGCATVRPIACFPDDLVLITERAQGETLGSLLEREATWYPSGDNLSRVEEHLARTGRWIRTFQEQMPSGGAFSLPGMREYIDVRLRRLTGMRLAAFSEGWRSGLLRYFDARSREVEGGDLAESAIHADIAPGNVLVNREEIIVIDFAMATMGGKYHDVSRLYTQLEFFKCKPKFRPAVIDRLQAALISGFEPGLTANHPLFELFLVQHTLCHLANLAGHPGSGLSRAYNSHQRRAHRRWLMNTCGPAFA
jgi:hypothetical protein